MYENKYCSVPTARKKYNNITFSTDTKLLTELFMVLDIITFCSVGAMSW